MSEAFRDVLTDLAQRGDMTAVYANSDDLSAFFAGFVKAVGAGVLSMWHVHPEGADDGVSVLRLSDILCVETGTQQLKALSLLHRERPGGVADSQSARRTPGKDIHSGTCPLVVELGEAVRTKDVVSIIYSTEGSDTVIQGFVTEVKDSLVCVEQLTQYGECDGFSTIALDKISCMDRDGSDERRIHFFYEHRALLFRERHGEDPERGSNGAE